MSDIQVDSSQNIIALPSYKGYIVALNQSGSNAPIPTVFQDDLNMPSWENIPGSVPFTGIGCYRCLFPAPLLLDKIFIPNGTDWNTNATNAIPLFDGTSIVGYIIISIGTTVDESGTYATELNLYSYDGSFVQKELGELVDRFPIEIRVYP